MQQTSTMDSGVTVSSSTTPLLGRSKTLPKKTPALAGKIKGKSNGNIMAFFKKAEAKDTTIAATEEGDDGLFVKSVDEVLDLGGPTQTPTPPHDTDSEAYEDAILTSISPLSRYNEEYGSSKRRKIEDDASRHSSGRDSTPTHAPKGPFLDDSDDEVESIRPLQIDLSENPEVHDRDSPPIDWNMEGSASREKSAEKHPDVFMIPSLKHESTSTGGQDGFDDMDDFMDEEFPEDGEEYMERRWMEEQAEMEAEMETEMETENQAEMEQNEGDGVGIVSALEMKKAQVDTVVLPQDGAASTCPICGGNTTGLTDEQISVHVNECLDGKAAPLQERESKPTTSASAIPVQSSNGVPGHKRFQRAAIARPGQENPFSLNQNSSKSSSAFSKLMSGHAEDNAWATAAAAEAASRGKPAYQRTCPFYKIMPGLFICVDAFRYGAVQGCNAYFLSHFHSDHYIGLTSSWCHGPIYCSHVTANLVRRQLRVDPKWVVDLEFDAKIEVPNTQGVEVTMIPANHCPGSSLFLFEKIIGTGKTPKVQRILHCGDFRACPAHVQHPKLRPEILDLVSGKLAQQKLDVCYLDTTYLTPKYAFPTQEDVIKACADMCISLSKDFVDENDGWEQVKKERAGEGMVKFVQKVSVKEEESDDTTVKIEDDQSKPTKVSSSAKKARGRLLVIVGTYSIGKERICLGVAKALDSKIYAPPQKQKIVAALEDPELSARMTNDPLEAQVHMQMLMEIRAETLADYLTGFKPHFSRIVGFRPSGWNYRPPNSRFTESPSVQTVLHSENWKSRYSMAELVPQRGSTRDSSCFGVPYSEHSSFRELSMFCCALRIDKIIPTVNVGSAKSREKMKAWCEKWAMEKKKSGLYKVDDGQVSW